MILISLLTIHLLSPRPSKYRPPPQDTGGLREVPLGAHPELIERAPPVAAKAPWSCDL